MRAALSPTTGPETLRSAGRASAGSDPSAGGAVMSRIAGPTLCITTRGRMPDAYSMKPVAAARHATATTHAAARLRATRPARARTPSAGSAEAPLAGRRHVGVAEHRGHRQRLRQCRDGQRRGQPDGGGAGPLPHDAATRRAVLGVPLQPRQPVRAEADAYGAGGGVLGLRAGRRRSHGLAQTQRVAKVLAGAEQQSRRGGLGEAEHGGAAHVVQPRQVVQQEGGATARLDALERGGEPLPQRALGRGGSHALGARPAQPVLARLQDTAVGHHLEVGGRAVGDSGRAVEGARRNVPTSASDVASAATRPSRSISRANW